MKSNFRLALMASLLLVPSSISAENNDQVIYPAGSSFGMIPFKGSSEAEEFSGFADRSDNRSVMIVKLPLDGWDEISSAFKDREILKERGINPRTIQDMEISGLPAVQLSGTQSLQGLTIPKCILIVKGKSAIGMFTAQIPEATDTELDACKLINGVTERETVTPADQLAALPFKLASFGDMRVVRTLASSGVLLTRGKLDVVKEYEQPIAIVVSSIRPSAAGQDRQAFAEKALRDFGNFDFEGPFSTSKLTIGGKEAIALETDAIDSKSEKKVRIVQWIMFADDGNYARIIGVSRRDQWAQSYPAFKNIRDGLSWTK